MERKNKRSFFKRFRSMSSTDGGDITFPSSSAPVSPVSLKPLDEPGGYDYEFVDPIPDELLCPTCNKVLKDAHQVGCCGKLFCLSCLGSMNFKNKMFRCPNCSGFAAINKFFRDVNVIRKIKELDIHCPNKECAWVGHLKALADHEEESCPDELVECQNEIVSTSNGGRKDVVHICGAMILRSRIQTHMTKQCQWRTSICPHCDEEGIYDHLSGVHLQTCPGIESPPCEENEGAVTLSSPHDNAGVTLSSVNEEGNAGVTLSSPRGNAGVILSSVNEEGNVEVMLSHNNEGIMLSSSHEEESSILLPPRNYKGSLPSSPRGSGGGLITSLSRRGSERGLAPLYPHGSGGGLTPSYPHGSGGGLASSYPHGSGGGLASSYPHGSGGGLTPSYPHGSGGGLTPSYPHGSGGGLIPSLSRRGSEGLMPPLSPRGIGGLMPSSPHGGSGILPPRGIERVYRTPPRVPPRRKARDDDDNDSTSSRSSSGYEDLTAGSLGPYVNFTALYFNNILKHLDTSGSGLKVLKSVIETCGVVRVVTEMKNGSESLSSSFYVRKGSYKLSMKLDYHNCTIDDMSKAELHVSIGLVPGRYDDLITWPSFGKLKLQLLNQRDDVNHKACTTDFHFQECPSSSGDKGVSWMQVGKLHGPFEDFTVLEQSRSVLYFDVITT